MPLNFTAFSLILFTIILPVLGQKLLPVNIQQYEAAFGLQRRNFDHLQDFHPQAQTELIYGLDQDEDKALVANITLQASPGLPLVLLERFEHLTTQVDCRGRDGHMSLTFISMDAFQQALKAWRYINNHADHQFLVIANHDGCAPEDDRQPYLITQIREDPISLTTHLKSQPVKWNHISENLDMTVAAVKRQPSSGQQHPLNYRGLSHEKTNLRARGVSELTNRGDPFRFNWATEKGKRTKFIQSLSNNVQAFCTNCLARGSFLFTFSVSKKGGLIDASNLSISGSNLEAAVTLSLLKRSKNQVEDVDRFSEDIDVIGTAIPGLGLQIGNWAKAGLSWAYQIGYSGSIAGNFELSVTVKTKNPGSSLLTLDMIRFDTRESNVDNWQFFEPEFNIIKLGGTANFEFYGQLAGVFGFEVIDTVTLEAKVAIPLPVFKFQLIPQKSQGGLCEAAGIDTGVIAQVKFGTQVTMSGTYKFTGKSDKDVGIDPIIDATIPIGNPICVPYKIPVASQQGKKPRPEQKPPAAKPAAAGNKELSYNVDGLSDGSSTDDSSTNEDLLSDMTAEDFSGHLPSTSSNDNLASLGDSLDDGSTPGSVTVAFEDPELIALQPAPVGGKVNPAGTTGDLTASIFDDGTSGQPAGDFVPSTPSSSSSSSSSSTEGLAYDVFLNDGSKINPGGDLTTPSAEIASNTGSSGGTTEPLYNFFLDDASNTGAGQFTAFTTPDQPLLDDPNTNSNNNNNNNNNNAPSPLPALTFPSLASAGTTQNSDASLFNTDDNTAGTTPDPQIAESTSQQERGVSYSFLPGTDLLGGSSSTSSSEQQINLFSTEDLNSSNLASLPAAGDDNTDLFADSLSTGSDLFSSSPDSGIARKLRRQELERAYPGPEGWGWGEVKLARRK